MLPNFSYVRPTSLSDTVEQLRSDRAVLHAGGTDLLGCLRDGVLSADKVVAIRDLEELRGISPTSDGGLRIGALTTLAEIAAHPTIAELYGAVSNGAASAASPQLRNQGTLGGNLCQRPRCWYYRGSFDCLRKGGGICYAVAGENQHHCILGGSGCYIVHPSDLAPALVAFDTSVRLVSTNGSRVIPLGSFFVPPSEDVRRENVLRPGELVTEVLLPPAVAGQRSTYRKVRSRGAWDFALAGVAAVVTVADGRVEGAGIVLSGVAPVPWRAEGAEATVVNTRLDTDTIARAATASVADASPLTRNGYKVQLVRGLVQETLQTLARQ